MQSPSQAGLCNYSSISCSFRFAQHVTAVKDPVAASWTTAVGVVANTFCFFICLVTSTDITVWIISALLAIGIGLSKYAKWRTRNKLVRDLAAMDQERREKVLSRMNPQLAMEARQELMRRFHMS
jgi:hypothetical protein